MNVILLDLYLWRKLKGREKTFGEGSDFVNVRVPKSKRQYYREEIKEFVEKEFVNASKTKIESIKIVASKFHIYKWYFATITAY